MKGILLVFVLGLSLIVSETPGEQTDLNRRVRLLELSLASIQEKVDLLPKNNDKLKIAFDDQNRLQTSELGMAINRISELENQNILLKATVAELQLKFDLIQKGNEELVKLIAPQTAQGPPIGGTNGMAVTPDLLQQIIAMGGANSMALPPEFFQQGQVNPMGGANSFVLTPETIKQTCPQTLGEGWTCSWSDYFGCYCILADDVGKTLQEAKSLCEGFGVQLVAIETPEEQEHLANQLFKILKGKGIGYFDKWFWTSGYYPGEKLVWASTNQSIEFTTWIGGKQAPKGDNRFVYMDSREPFNWGYTQDGYRLNTICEGPPLPTYDESPATKPCPDDIGSNSTCKQINGFGCYCAALFQETQQGASEHCRKHGMELASIETEDENIVIRALLKQIRKTYTFLTSGSNTKRDGNWIWSTTGQKVNYTNWGEGEPDNERQILLLKWDYPFLWSTTYDWSSEYFICEL